MTKGQAIKILKHYNKWRKGANIEQPSPQEIGEAIVFAIKYLKDGTTKNENSKFCQCKKVSYGYGRPVCHNCKREVCLP